MANINIRMRKERSPLERFTEPDTFRETVIKRRRRAKIGKFLKKTGKTLQKAIPPAKKGLKRGFKSLNQFIRERL